MSAYAVRHASREDLPGLLPFWRDLYATEVASGMSYGLRADAAEIWLQETERKLGSKMYVLLVAEHAGGGLAGFHSLQMRKRSPIYEEPWVGSVIEIYVAPSHRGKQVARLMSEMGVRLMLERGVRQMEVQTVSGNQGSQAFWQSVGWTCELIQYRKDLTKPS